MSDKIKAVTESISPGFVSTDIVTQFQIAITAINNVQQKTVDHALAINAMITALERVAEKLDELQAQNNELRSRLDELDKILS